MSEQVTLYKFSKRLNSTKQATTGTVLTGSFRGPLDIMTPSIDIEMTSNSFDYNYLTWYDSTNSLQRYYWIKNKVYYPNKIVSCSLEEDILATFKDEIKECTFLVERSATIPSVSVIDIAPTSIDGIDVAVTTVDQFEHFADGWYVVGVAGSNDPLAFAISGGVYYFLCDGYTLFTLITWLNDGGSSGEWADYNPISRIVSIRYFPISFNAYATSTFVDLFYHAYDDGQGTMIRTYYRWNGNFVMTTGLPGISHDVIYTKSFSMTFSNHSQYETFKRYLNYPPYREVTLFAGAFGKIDIPLNLLTRPDDDNKITIDVTFDLISGLSRIEIYFDTAKTQLVYSSEDYSMSVDCAITSETYNKYSDILARDLRKSQAFAEGLTKAGMGAGSMIGGALTQNPLMLGSGIALLASAATTQVSGFKQYALDSYNLSIPDVHTKGTNGSFSMLEKPWKLYTISHIILDFPYTLLGYPCHKAIKLSTSLGYTKCVGASFESNKATLEEILAVNDYLNNGFYYE